MKRRYLKWFVNTVLAVDVFILLFGFYILLVPVKVVDVHGLDAIANPNKTMVAGSVVAYQVDYCKYKDAQATIVRNLIGELTYTLPPNTNNIPVGCHKIVNRSSIVPLGVEPGVYHIELVATYHLFWGLRPITVRSETEDFTVVTNATEEPSDAAQSVGADTTLPTTTPAAATRPAASPSVYGTDPVTSEEPSVPSPSPGLLRRLIQGL